MIKLYTEGMYEVAKVNPVLTSVSAIKNNSFLTVDSVDYLIMNELGGDDWGKEDIELAAGEYLNGFDLKALENQELVIDAKHIAFGVDEKYDDDITAGTTLFVIDTTTKKIKIGTKPASGVYFKCIAKCRLTEKAVKVRVLYA